MNNLQAKKSEFLLCTLHPLYSFQINFSEAFSLSIPRKNVIYQTQQLVLHGNTKGLYVYPKYSVTHLIFTFLLGAQCAINALLVFDIYIFNSLFICVKTTLRQSFFAACWGLSSRKQKIRKQANEKKELILLQLPRNSAPKDLLRKKLRRFWSQKIFV